MSGTNVCFRELRSTDHSRHYDGSIAAEIGSIPAYQEVPYDQKPSTYFHLTGWGCTIGAGNLPRCTSVKAGHTAVSIAHTGRGFHNALQRNAEEIAIMLDSLGGDDEKRVIALSESGATAVRGLRMAKTAVRSLTVVAPAEIIMGDTPFSLLLRAASMAKEELKDFLDHPLVGARLLAAGFSVALRRPAAMVSEALELSTHTSHEDLRAIKEVPNPPHLRLVACQEDRLMPPTKLAAAAENLPFDEVITYRGRNAGHLALIYDAGLTEMILKLDETA
jgi:hypothetical protein